MRGDSDSVGPLAGAPPPRAAASTTAGAVALPPPEKEPTKVRTFSVRGDPDDSVARPAAAAAPRALLLEEKTADYPKGRQYAGTVAWRSEQVRDAAGAGAETAVRADIWIPEARLRLTLSFRRNADAALPASHTVDLGFILPGDFAGGGVVNVAGILMKTTEQERGDRLAGLTVKVTDNVFMAGLSNLEADRARNVELLKTRPWLDLPLTYADGRRAILAIDKGAPGGRAFATAFAAWEQVSAPAPATAGRQ